MYHPDWDLYIVYLFIFIYGQISKELLTEKQLKSPIVYTPVHIIVTYVKF